MWKDIFLYSNSSIFFLLMIFIQQFADNEDLQLEWIEAKRRNKIRVASFLKEKTGYVVNPNAMFDVQVGFLSPTTSFLSSTVLVNISIEGLECIFSS